MKLSEMRELLAREEIQLTKSLGQNFLHDGNQLRRIVDAAELSKTDKVLEIGPGLGPLTELLVKNAGNVLAIEKDARLIKVLETRFKGAPGFQLLHDDALEFLKDERRDWSEWKLVANLPYSVASPILVELAAGGRSPRRMVQDSRRLFFSTTRRRFRVCRAGAPGGAVVAGGIAGGFSQGGQTGVFAAPQNDDEAVKGGLAGGRADASFCGG
jgi:hypothetical protein